MTRASGGSGGLSTVIQAMHGSPAPLAKGGYGRGSQFWPMTQEDQSSSLWKRDFCKLPDLVNKTEKNNPQIQTGHPVKI